MLTLIGSFLTGIIGPLLPTVLNLFRDWQDRKHELEMLAMRLKYANQEHLWKMEEINATADIEEAKILHTQQQSFGVQLLDAADKWADSQWGKCIVTPVFFLYAILDFLNGLVRPAIAYAAFGFYVVYKWSVFEMAKVSVTTVEAVNATWTDNDWAVLLMVLGFFFGQRAAKMVIGGSSQNARANG